MAVALREIAYARESGHHYYPFWRVTYESDGTRRWCEVQAQTAMCAEQVFCGQLGVPWPLAR
jgi:hypothetical protein